MKKNVFHFVVLSIFSAFSTLVAQETKQKVEQLNEVVITDSRFKIKRENSGKVVHLISTEQIKQSVGKNIVDLLNNVAGIEINGNNSVAGQVLGYYVRGGRSKEVVILIDGIQVYDPASIGGFDLNTINLEQVESIEIIKGAASTLYGSGAATAVIDIRLKKAKEGAVNATLSTSFGTNNTSDKSSINIADFNNAINVNGTAEKLSYSVSFGHKYSEGMSAAKVAEGVENNFNDDPYSRINTGINVAYKASEKINLAVFATFNKVKNNYDGGINIDADNMFLSKDYRVGFAPSYKYNKGSIHLNATYSLYDMDRTKTSYPGTSEGENLLAELYIKHKFSNAFYAILGANAQKNKIESYAIPWGEAVLEKVVYVEDPETTIIDPYLNGVYISDFGLNLNAGARLNTHNKYGNHFVYNFNPSYTLKYEGEKYSKLFASYSTAFVAPTVQDLYASWGNLDLEPQESLTYEGGIETKMNNFMLSATYFQRDVENLIAYDFDTYAMVNKGDLTAKGVEVVLNYGVAENIDFSLNYTFTEKDNDAIRIPKHKVNANIFYVINNITNVSLNYQFNDKRTDLSNELEAYTLVDFSVNREIIKNRLKASASVSNILNEEYEESFGYSTKGRNFKIGLEFKF